MQQHRAHIQLLPHQSVCHKCAGVHAEAEPCERTLYCMACKNDGHLVVGPTCLACTASSPGTNSKVQDGVPLADRIRNHGHPSTNAVGGESSRAAATVYSPPPSPQYSDPILQTVLSELASLRTELHQVCEESAQLKAKLAASKLGSHTTPTHAASSTSITPEKMAYPPSTSYIAPAKSALRNTLA